MLDLTPWRERRELDRIKREMDRLFDQFFDWRPFRRTAEGDWIPSVDISETGREIVVDAELPGMSADDIDISLNGRLLTIKGEKKKETEEREEDYHRIERRYGAFSRSFELPAEVDAEKVEASFKSGVLRLMLPKTEEKAVKKIEVKTS